MVLTFGVHRGWRAVQAVAVAAGLSATGSSVYAGHSLEEWVGVNDGGRFAQFNHTFDGSEAILPSGAGAITASAHASASYGRLHAYAYGIAAGTSGYSWVSANARFTDSITITGGVGTGFFNCDMTIEGSLVHGGGFPTAGVSWSNSGGATIAVGSGTTTIHGTQSTAFTYGVPFDFSAQLSTLVSWANAGGTGEGLADFGNTAWLANISVTDSLGNPLAYTGVTGEAGTDYTAIPAPSAAAALFSATLLGLGARRRRRADVQPAGPLRSRPIG